MESSLPVYKTHLLKRGWIIGALFGLLLAFFFTHLYWQQQEMEALKRHQEETVQEIERLKQEIAYAYQALHSLDDPDWIDRQMIEKLGVVPKGYRALYPHD